MYDIMYDAYDAEGKTLGSFLWNTPRKDRASLEITCGVFNKTANDNGLRGLARVVDLELLLKAFA